MLASGKRFFSSSSLRQVSAWAKVEKAPADKILGLTVLYNQDTNPSKINLGVGAYRDENGKPWILPSVRKAEEVLIKTEVNKEYVPITGSPKFNELIKQTLYGNDPAGKQLLEQNRIVSSQSISGTGALKVLSEFIKYFHEGPKDVLVPNPTWANHIAILERSGLTTSKYRYYDFNTNQLDKKGLLEDLENAAEGQPVLLHACCHNPTGVDPTLEEFDEIIDVLSRKKLLPVVDMAYQGFRSGNPIDDLSLLFRFNKAVVDGRLDNFVLSQSFAKNMGLYGERVGSLSLITSDADESVRVKSQLEKVIRPIYSSPPSHGSKLVEIVLSDEAIYQQWLKDVKVMSDRLVSMRKLLYDTLKNKYNNPLDWSHLLQQKGMFCYTGLNPEQVAKLIERSVYLTSDGRISIAGIYEQNVDYLANAIHEVTTN
ncbi:Aspartate aminotransferase, mitochondrial [Komagataella phaffii CBS 7435]|uniref:Aspartate aminotransferase n=2 Tax=Komagataella phaffii TaxID=460519 RepID=C4QWE4_KOMPG|nr:Cytosolic aspartate aminotransferase; involved in nitrogen metabolism [Komagataella phaffii GS115]AOA61675.1 GQ67_02780T0 [Komagataella phaffii]CAH2446237.1 Aspartate aminotransferase, mitochondrial [Komagataella phaffii CBS 7435]AOA66056.1 GQ68_02468T0 [Komagataella phaffii GS115]CAY67567.1 Cytosolic aspartate aminotransferase; involved in nitrogen metabolism [Komagataella phaffii GS115]CCA36663.1 Aspartate aminotransferase, mitochondrial [Komagataella phaffii CBS 7435]